jgi:hypothetical protein
LARATSPRTPARSGSCRQVRSFSCTVARATAAPPGASSDGTVISPPAHSSGNPVPPKGAPNLPPAAGGVFPDLRWFSPGVAEQYWDFASGCHPDPE